MIQIKRIYDKPDKNDGRRILVDRLWPRGIKKENARIDLWLKDIAPSDELRKWFSHDPVKWPEFRTRYKEELKNKPELLKQLREESKKEDITLLFSAKDTEHNNAAVLKEVLSRKVVRKT
jgi:uncharacterized protein YeaO (DUF488 family)